ncbi:MAG: 16S rRNA (adenine(1518)-N(6)/adenine(1519)-N(6))-dimethyltransferase RsmA, partial [Candidatus Cloacimonadaceae bacterium]|nr:16S rRNA (adenine(1518)-N(6)/adenine(1519)-N(6))-dimethyltransferase RsmA [Candidatus Cloacimonadaceae bacterium]
MKANKDLGQHFLNDISVADDIVAAAALQSGEPVWEIGPGLGILSRQIIATGARLKAFELDRRFEPILRTSFADKIELVMKDILRVDWDAELAKETPVKLVANIPYQITSPLLYKICEHSSSFSCIVMMMQKEVAYRLQASPATKDYGQITLRIAMDWDIELLFHVGKEKFDPSPQVDSAVIRMTPRKVKPHISNLDIFLRLINLAFAHRRKTLRNNLKVMLNKDQIDEL